MSLPNVFIIILNWNNYADTIECIRSVRKSSYKNLHMIIADNHSDNDSEAILRMEFPELMIIQTGANLGFSGGNNVAIKHALKQGADYVLLLNNDTVVKSDFLEYLVEAGEKDETVGVLGGKTYNFYDTKRLCSAGADINWLKGTAAFHRGEGKIDEGKFDELCYVTFVPGYFMLIKSRVIDQIGYLDERYFLGVEEIDFCVRVKKAGFNLLYVPKGVIWHKVTASHKKYEPMFIYNGYRNKLMFMKTYLNYPTWLLWFSLFKVYAFLLAPFRLKAVSNSVGETLDYREFRKVCKKAFQDRYKEKVTLEDLLQFKQAN